MKMMPIHGMAIMAIDNREQKLEIKNHSIDNTKCQYWAFSILQFEINGISQSIEFILAY